MFKFNKALFFLSTVTFSLTAEICNLAVAKKAVEHHYENGGYHEDLQKIVAAVREYFSYPALHNKQVIIFDVDEVALSIYPWFKEYDFAMPW